MTRETLKESSRQNLLFFFFPINSTYRLNTWYSRRSGATAWQTEHSYRPEEAQERRSEESAIFVERPAYRYGREKPGTCEKDKKPVNGTEISITNVSNRKTGLPFQKFHFSRKISSGIHQKNRVSFSSQSEFPEIRCKWKTTKKDPQNVGCFPLCQKFRKFRLEIKWNGSVRPENFRKKELPLREVYLTDRTSRSETCRSILTNRFVALLLFCRFSLMWGIGETNR